MVLLPSRILGIIGPENIMGRALVIIPPDRPGDSVAGPCVGFMVNVAVVILRNIGRLFGCGLPGHAGKIHLHVVDPYSIAIAYPFLK